MVKVLLNGYENYFDDDISVEMEVVDGTIEPFLVLNRKITLREACCLDEDSRNRLDVLSKIMHQEMNLVEWPPCSEGFDEIFTFLLSYFDYDNAMVEAIFMFKRTLEAMYYSYSKIILAEFWGENEEFYRENWG